MEFLNDPQVQKILLIAGLFLVLSGRLSIGDLLNRFFPSKPADPVPPPVVQPPVVSPPVTPGPDRPVIDAITQLLPVILPVVLKLLEEKAAKQKDG